MTEAPKPMTRVERRRAERAAAEVNAAALSSPSALTPDLSVEAGRQNTRTAWGQAGRLGLLGLLAAVTVAAPLSPLADNAMASTAALGASAQATATASAAIQADTESVASTVLGTDFSSMNVTADSELNNVEDAATRARIREAYENATVTCSDVTQSAASGDVTAFVDTPQVYYPMMEDTYTVSSVYGWRLHPTLGYMKLHAGQDFAASVGTPIYAAAAGTVVYAGMESNGTGVITIEHEIDGEVWYTRYLHMYSSGIYVTEGQEVAAGELIAGVGNTGNSTGAHLHFEVRTANNSDDDSSVDPVQWLEDHDAQQLSDSCS